MKTILKNSTNQAMFSIYVIIIRKKSNISVFGSTPKKQIAFGNRENVCSGRCEGQLPFFILLDFRWLGIPSNTIFFYNSIERADQPPIR
jgi:hypothetical protein